LRIDAKEVEDLLLFVAAVTAGVDTYSRELATLTPALDGQGRDSKEVGNFADSEEVGEGLEIEFLVHQGFSLASVVESVNREWFDIPKGRVK